MPDLTLTIESLAAGGEGLARFEGKSVFVGMSAPGDTLRCRVSEDHGTWARAEILEILEASPLRVPPSCALYGICGGCDLQHLDYAAQLAAKTKILKDAFSRIGGFEPPEPQVFPSAPFEYRNRIQLHRKPRAAGAREERRSTRGGSPGRVPRKEARSSGEGGFGFKARKSGDIVPAADCPIAAPEIRGALRKEAGGESVLSPPPGKERFTVYGRNGLLLCEGGETRGKTKILQKEITLDASVFFQSNGETLETLIVHLREAARLAALRASRRNSGGAELSMADLYCGVGTFACFLAEYFTRIDLMEENKNALALARENLISKGAERSGETRALEFFALKDTEWIKLPHPRYDFAVLDPPRQGLSPELARFLAGNGPPDLAYVSCAPATLARDSKILRLGGYVLSGLRLYDFYPQTSHIESLALFSR